MEDQNKHKTKQSPPLRKYFATCTITETYYTEVEACSEEEAFEICMEIPEGDLEFDDSLGEWELEEIEEKTKEGAA